LWERQIINSY